MKKTFVGLFATLVLVGGATQARAQTGALASITIQFLQNGAALPTQTQVILLPAGAVCGQPQFPTSPPPIVYITSSARIIWSDPANPVLLCIATQAPGSVLLSLPLGANYAMTGKFTNDYGVESLVSAVSNTFTRGAAPAPSAPTGVQVRP